MAPDMDLAQLEAKSLNYQNEFVKLRESSKGELQENHPRLGSSLEQECAQHVEVIDADLIELQKLLFKRPIGAQHDINYLLAEHCAQLHQQLVDLKKKTEDSLATLKEDAEAKARTETEAEKQINAWKSQLKDLFAMEKEMRDFEQDAMGAENADNQTSAQIESLELEERGLAEEAQATRSQLEESEKTRSDQAVRIKDVREEVQLCLQREKEKDSWTEATKSLLETLGSATVTHASDGEIHFLLLCHLPSGATAEHKAHIAFDPASGSLLAAKVKDVDVYIEDIVTAAQSSDMPISSFVTKLKHRILVGETRKLVLKEIGNTTRCDVTMESPKAVSAMWPNQVVAVVEVGVLWPEVGQPQKIRSISGPPVEKHASLVTPLVDTWNRDLQTGTIDLPKLLETIGRGLVNIGVRG